MFPVQTFADPFFILCVPTFSINASCWDLLQSGSVTSRSVMVPPEPWLCSAEATEGRLGRVFWIIFTSESRSCLYITCCISWSLVSSIWVTLNVSVLFGGRLLCVVGAGMAFFLQLNREAPFCLSISWLCISKQLHRSVQRCLYFSWSCLWLKLLVGPPDCVLVSTEPRIFHVFIRVLTQLMASPDLCISV